jgi:hypothetical protein
MSDDKLSQLHQVLKEPLRQKILLQLGNHKRLTLNDLIKNLRAYNIEEISQQLDILLELTVEGEHLVSNQANDYELTEKGHFVLDEMIAFPELESDNYREKFLGETNQSSTPSNAKPNWFSPYWAVIFVSTVIVVGIVIPFFGHQLLERTIFYAAISLLIVGFGYYIRVKPSITLNRIVYVGLLGFLIGDVLWFLGLAIAITSLPNTDSTEATVFVVLTTVSFTAGPIIGYLIGKARHFKGPQQYSP